MCQKVLVERQTNNVDRDHIAAFDCVYIVCSKYHYPVHRLYCYYGHVVDTVSLVSAFLKQTICYWYHDIAIDYNERES